MREEETPELKFSRKTLMIRVGACAGLIVFGLLGMMALASLKKPPAEAQKSERALKVKVLAVQSETVPVTITGYGQVKTLNSANISAEVAGQVLAVHPRLEVGEVIDEGELMFRIDDRNYTAALAQSRAEVSQLRSVVTRLNKQAAIDTERLKTLERSRELAKAEFDRVRSLFEQHSVGTRSSVDRAEQAYNATADQTDQMAQAVTLYPMRIKEAQSSLAAASARLKQAQANVERCRITAPFKGRLTMAAVEQGQYVTPAQPLLTLADDSVLEILVPLDGRDVRRWLRFADKQEGEDQAWFGKPEPVACLIHWTEDKKGHTWTGRLHRIVNYDHQTRTITVAVRVKSAAAVSEKGGLPLVEGMFCSVAIPGHTLEAAFQVPRSVVSFENTVFMAKENRLKTVNVQVARIDGDFAYITGGLSNGDQVIITRLVDPLENSLLEILPGE